MKVTILVPVNARPAAVAEQPWHVDELAKAVGDALAIEVPIVEGMLADAPATGYVIVFELRADAPVQQGPRIVAFDADRSSIMKRVESHNLAAAVEKQRYFQWRTRREQERGYGLVGRKDVVARMPAEITTGPYTSARYGLISSDAARDLPTLLASYLTTYAQVVANA